MDLQSIAIIYLLYYIVLFILILYYFKRSNTKVWEYIVAPFITMLVSAFIPFLLGAVLGAIMLLWKIILIAIGG